MLQCCRYVKCYTSCCQKYKSEIITYASIISSLRTDIRNFKLIWSIRNTDTSSLKRQRGVSMKKVSTRRELSLSKYPLGVDDGNVASLLLSKFAHRTLYRPLYLGAIVAPDVEVGRRRKEEVISRDQPAAANLRPVEPKLLADAAVVVRGVDVGEVQCPRPGTALQF